MNTLDLENGKGNIDILLSTKRNLLSIKKFQWRSHVSVYNPSVDVLFSL